MRKGRTVPGADVPALPARPLNPRRIRWCDTQRTRGAGEGHQGFELPSKRGTDTIDALQVREATKRSAPITVVHDSLCQHRPYSRQLIELFCGGDIDVDRDYGLRPARCRLPTAGRRSNRSYRRRGISALCISDTSRSGRPFPHSTSRIDRGELAVDGASRCSGRALHCADGAERADRSPQQRDPGHEQQRLPFRGSRHGARVTGSLAPQVSVSSLPGAKRTTRRFPLASHRTSSVNATSPTICRLFADTLSIVSCSV